MWGDWRSLIWVDYTSNIFLAAMQELTYMAANAPTSANLYFSCARQGMGLEKRTLSLKVFIRRGQNFQLDQQ
jgi:hypothetical protein